MMRGPASVQENKQRLQLAKVRKVSYYESASDKCMRGYSWLANEGFPQKGSKYSENKYFLSRLLNVEKEGFVKMGLYLVGKCADCSIVQSANECRIY